MMDEFVHQIRANIAERFGGAESKITDETVADDVTDRDSCARTLRICTACKTLRIGHSRRSALAASTQSCLAPVKGQAGVKMRIVPYACAPAQLEVTPLRGIHGEAP